MFCGTCLYQSFQKADETSSQGSWCCGHCILNPPQCFAKVLVTPLWILCLCRDLYSILDAIHSAISHASSCAFSCCFVLTAILNICTSTGVMLLCDILLFHLIFVLLFAFTVLFLFLEILMTVIDIYIYIYIRGVYLSSRSAFAFPHTEQYRLLSIKYRLVE